MTPEAALQAPLQIPSLGSIPGPPQMRILGSRGNLIQFRRDPIAYMQRLHSRYGKIAAFIQGRPGTVFAFGPENNQFILGNAALFHSTYILRGGPPGSAQSKISHSLFSMNGELHARHRRLVMPPFHRQAFEGYCETMVAISNRMLESWTPGARIDVERAMKEYVISVTGEILFAFTDDSKSGQIAALIDRWLRIGTSFAIRTLPRNWPGSPYRRMLATAEHLEQRIRGIIAERRTSGAGGSNVLSLLIKAQDEEGFGLSDDDLLGHMNLLFVAAYGTMSQALSWTLFLLAQHPQIRSDLTDELRGALGGGAPSVGALAKLPLLERVIKESMRLLPPLPYSSRTSNAAFELGPYQFPARTTMAFSHYITHHLPEIYPEPERFNPDRWLAIRPSPYEYLPFGAGPHVCLGAQFAMMTMKVALACILQRFQLNVVPGSRIDREVTLTLSSKGGMPMTIQTAEHSPLLIPVRGNIHEMVQLEKV
jgi:cytochrome P450